MTYHGRKRPQPGSATARVWEIADVLRRERGRLPSGREVVDAYVAEGGKEGTGFTQYSHWKKAQGPSAEAPERARVTVEPDGRVVLPPDFVAAMDLGTDRSVTAVLEDGAVRLISPRVGLRRARAYVRAFDKGTGSVVDEFIAEKRLEAERE